jgi:hypothetical protein
MYTLKLLWSIDEWDKYCSEWQINETEVREFQEDKSWYLETDIGSIAYSLEGDRIADIIKITI